MILKYWKSKKIFWIRATLKSYLESLSHVHFFKVLHKLCCVLTAKTTILFFEHLILLFSYTSFVATTICADSELLWLESSTTTCWVLLLSLFPDGGRVGSLIAEATSIKDDTLSDPVRDSDMLVETVDKTGVVVVVVVVVVVALMEFLYSSIPANVLWVCALLVRVASDEGDRRRSESLIIRGGSIIWAAAAALVALEAAAASSL